MDLANLDNFDLDFLNAVPSGTNTYSNFVIDNKPANSTLCDEVNNSQTAADSVKFFTSQDLEILNDVIFEYFGNDDAAQVSAVDADLENFFAKEEQPTGCFENIINYAFNAAEADEPVQDDIIINTDDLIEEDVEEELPAQVPVIPVVRTFSELSCDSGIGQPSSPESCGEAVIESFEVEFTNADGSMLLKRKDPVPAFTPMFTSKDYPDPTTTGYKKRKMANTFFCDICNCELPSKGYLKRHETTKKHLQILHQLEKRKNIQQHQAEHPDEVMEMEESDEIPQQVAVQSNPRPNGQFSCNECFKTFTMRCYLKQHQNSQHSDRKFRCTTCGKKFESEDQLRYHMLKHGSQKPFQCTRCDKSYNNKVDLKRHEKNHESFRDNVCKLCGKGFVRHDHLMKHMLIHEKSGRIRHN
jgi:hypothetical protein